MFDEECFDDDEKMKKNVVIEKEKESVRVNDEGEKAEDTVKQARKRKRIRKRKIYKNKNMALPWLGRAPHFSPLSHDPSSTLLISTAARWRVLGHHSRGNGDARSESTPSSGMIYLPYFSI